MTYNPLSRVTVDQLRRAIEIREQIEQLENELNQVLGGSEAGEPAGAPPPARARRTGKGTRSMSDEARARISAAQKARWAARRAESPATNSRPAKQKRHLSEAARARISAAAKTRWAKYRAAKRG